MPPQFNDLLDNFTENKTKWTKIAFSASAVILLVFLVAVSSFPLKDQLLSSLFPKSTSKAAEPEAQKTTPPQFLSDSLVVKVKSGFKNQIREDINHPGVGSLEAKFKQLKVKKFSQVIQPDPKDGDNDLFNWYKVELDEPPGIVQDEFEPGPQGRGQARKSNQASKIRSIVAQFKSDQSIETAEPVFVYSTSDCCWTGNLLDPTLQNNTIDNKLSSNSQTFTSPGVYTLTGSVSFTNNGGAFSGNAKLEALVYTTAGQYIASYPPDGRQITINSGQKILVVESSMNARATFSNVSLKYQTAGSNLISSAHQGTFVSAGIINECIDVTGGGTFTLSGNATTGGQIYADEYNGTCGGQLTWANGPRHPVGTTFSPSNGNILAVTYDSSQDGNVTYSNVSLVKLTFQEVLDPSLQNIILDNKLSNPSQTFTDAGYYNFTGSVSFTSNGGAFAGNAKLEAAVFTNDGQFVTSYPPNTFFNVNSGQKVLVIETAMNARATFTASLVRQIPPTPTNTPVPQIFPPNDTYANSSSSWGQPYRDLWANQKMSIDPAWVQVYQQSKAPVVVAVVDTGIDLNHEDLKDNLWGSPVDGSRGFNFVNNTNNPMDDYGHGTHVAGTIGAVGGNNKGIIGVAG